MYERWFRNAKDGLDRSYGALKMSEVCKHLTTSSSIWIALEHSNAIEVLCTFHGHTHET